MWSENSKSVSLVTAAARTPACLALLFGERSCEMVCLSSGVYLKTRPRIALNLDCQANDARPDPEAAVPAAKGLATKQIADRLFISPKTADHHIQHTYTKIGVSTRAAAALWAAQSGVLS